MTLLARDQGSGLFGVAAMSRSNKQEQFIELLIID
jgi:hypothetical protein